MRLLLPDDSDYAATLARLCERTAGSEDPPQVEQAVRAILADVRARGDRALREQTERIEGRTLNAIELDRVGWERECGKVSEDVRAALERAAGRIRAFHERARPAGTDASFVHEAGGVRLGLRVAPLARVGIYVPGGTARCPSTVLMTAIPARVAGVGEIVMVTPGPSPETLLAARLSGVDRLFPIGGAQAIAALAFGTESVPRVDKIVGPGNGWVACAKRLVYGRVDIDAIAGPSEVLILADGDAAPRLCAADLLAQAEHDVEACAVLCTTSAALAAEVAREVDLQLATLPRAAIAARALETHGALVVVRDITELVDFANRFAPEHAELLVADPRALAPSLTTCGAIFLGSDTPEPVGDYFAGPSHVLPTAGAARYGSPLGVYSFLRRTSIIEYDAAALRAQAADIVRLAKVEGLMAHARAVAARLTPATPLTAEPVEPREQGEGEGSNR